MFDFDRDFVNLFVQLLVSRLGSCGAFLFVVLLENHQNLDVFVIVEWNTHKVGTLLYFCTIRTFVDWNTDWTSFYTVFFLNPRSLKKTRGKERLLIQFYPICIPIYPFSLAVKWPSIVTFQPFLSYTYALKVNFSLKYKLILLFSNTCEFIQILSRIFLE